MTTLHDGFCRCRACKPGFAPQAIHSDAPAAKASRIEIAAYGLFAASFLTIALRVAQAAS